MPSNIRYAGLATLAMSLAACSNGGPNAATTTSTVAASPPAATVTRPQHTAPAAPAAPSGTKPAEFVTGTLCTRPDQVVFSCPLEKTHKIVSICAAGDAAPHRFYYAFGKADAPELVYPKKHESGARALNRTYLIFAGGTGGYVFSFRRGGFEYMAYSTSGKRTHDGGVLVRHGQADRAEMQFECKANEIIESQNDALIRESLKLEPASDLLNGLPRHSTRLQP